MRVPLMAPQAHTHNACRPWHRTSAASVVLAIGLLVSAITPASAIVDGQLDTGNEYPNVGTIQIFADGQWWLLGCTATLVAPDAVLTAAHCTADVFFGFVAPSDIRITFEAEPGENSVGYTAAAVLPHPDFWTSSPSPSSGINAKNYLGPGAEDIALIRLAQAVQGISPAPIASVGYLDPLNLADESFTAVGYGFTGFTTGSLVSRGTFGIEGFGARAFADVRILNLHDAYPDRYVKTSKANCPGDSGGPLFHGSTVVGIIVWTNSLRCEGPGLDYRVDSDIAHEFLASTL